MKALAKPNVAAWIVNQLARQRRDDVRELLAIGERLRAAQVAGRGEELREAVVEERRTIRSLVAAARALDGDRAGMPERVTAILRAAIADADARKLLELGRLTGDLEPSGFGAVAGVAPAHARDTKDDRRARRAELAEAKRCVRTLASESARLAKEADEAERAAERARTTADEAAAAAHERRAAAEEAARELAEAEAALAALEG